MNQERGSGLATFLVSIPLFLIFALVLTFAFYEGRKAYWDWRIHRMCEKDGGVTIFERVSLNPQEVAQMPRLNGYLSIGIQDASSSVDPVFGVMKTLHIRDARPQVSRFETSVIRRSDMRVVSTIVRYARIGGDFPSPAHDSSASCPSMQTETEDLAKLFQLQEPTK